MTAQDNDQAATNFAPWPLIGTYLSLTKRLGRFTLTGDDIIAHALDGMGEAGGTKTVCFVPVVLALKRRDGQAHAAPPERILPLLQRIRRGWRPARRVKFRP